MMNATDPRIQAPIQAALHRIKATAAGVADRVVESLGLTASAATGAKQREAYLAAQRDLRHKMAAFHFAFNETLREQVQRELAPRDEAGRRQAATDWQSLSLVDDQAVEELVSSDRLAQSIALECEWELRELSTYVASLLRQSRTEQDRNPLRPEILGKALFRAVDAVSDDPEARKVLGRELGRALSQDMRGCYGDIVRDLQARGVQPAGLAVRTADGPGQNLRHEPPPPASHEEAQVTRQLNRMFGSSRSGAPTTPGETLGLPSESGALYTTRGTPLDEAAPRAAREPRLPLGRREGIAPEADLPLMSLIRRLAFLGSGSGEFEALAQASAAERVGGAEALSGLMALNLIRAHREELRQASPGTLDHMVIDVVGSLFDQILSDPKVPPQMARQIARLQLPVLRVALGDSSFFSSRKHPVRRFVNRIASLACAFEDFSEGPGQPFLALVAELVQEIVQGDFDQIDLYEARLDRLEAFIAEQTQRDVREGGAADALLDSKEDELRVQQRYMLQLQGALAPVAMADFLREFLTQVWSQALVSASRTGGSGSEALQRLRRVGRDLVMSVQPKGHPTLRKAFLLQLPALMKDLNEGLVLIGWPEPAKKAFFGQLLPAHAESLKGQPLTELDRNLLVRQLDAVFGLPVPRAEDLGRADGLPVLDDVVAESHFSSDEMQRIGLIEESAVDWDGQVDIDLSAEPEALDAAAAPELRLDARLDLRPSEPPEPTQGLQLMEHIRLGFAYQMNLKDRWQKVRLSYVSPGRAFFVFTHGRKHQETISMTARMLARICETGRLRAFESAYLIERATLRARKQLAALRPGTPAH